MNWSKAKPAATGWYWQRYCLETPDRKVEVVYVQKLNGRLYVEDNDGVGMSRMELYSQAEYDWAGPLVEPV